MDKDRERDRKLSKRRARDPLPPIFETEVFYEFFSFLLQNFLNITASVPALYSFGKRFADGRVDTASK